jgi:DNA-binding transcriptional regulator YbjK
VQQAQSEQLAQRVQRVQADQQDLQVQLVLAASMALTTKVERLTLLYFLTKMI